MGAGRTEATELTNASHRLAQLFSAPDRYHIRLRVLALSGGQGGKAIRVARRPFRRRQGAGRAQAGAQSEGFGAGGGGGGGGLAGGAPTA